MECGRKAATCILKAGTVNETVCPLDQYFKKECEAGVIVEWGEACRALNN